MSNIYHPWHPGPLHIIIPKPRISISNTYHPWHPGPLHIITQKPRISIYLIFTIPGIQGLYISSSQNPESLYISYLPSLASRAFTYHHPTTQNLYKSNIYYPWHPGPLHIIIPKPRISIYLIFTIPGIQGLYISLSQNPESLHLIFKIPGIQGLYISPRLVPRIQWTCWGKPS